MSSNFNITFTSDAYQCKLWHMLWFEKSNKKPEFLANSMRFLFNTLLCNMSYVQIFCQVKDLTIMHNRGEFHLRLSSKTFAKFCVPIQHQLNDPFWVFLGPYSRKYSTSKIVQKLSPEVVIQQTKTLLENFWRIRVFMKKGRIQSLHFWFNFDRRFPMKIVEIEKKN